MMSDKKRQLVKCSKCSLVHNKDNRVDDGHGCPNCGSVWIDLTYSNPVNDYADAKEVTGKIDLTTVPPAIIESVAKVRMDAIARKYKDPENWRRVPWEEYWRAMLRHTLAMMRDPMSIDYESGLLHLEHIVCNAAFILEMWRGTESGEGK